MAEAPPDRLPCGTPLAVLLEQAFDGSPPADPEHQRSCRHCQRALRRIRAAAADVHGVASAEVLLPRDLIRSVMARVRGRPTLITVEIRENGDLRIADQVFADIAREAALQVGAVSHASVIATEAAGGPGRVGLRARLVVSVGPFLPDVAAEVRRAIVTAIRRRTGASAQAVDVLIDDLS